MNNGPITRMPGYRTNKMYVLQGWNAAVAGFKIEDCPYFATSPAEGLWRKGFRSR